MKAIKKQGKAKEGMLKARVMDNEVYIQLGKSKGISITLRNRDFADNRAIYVSIFAFGTFLGLNPNRSRHCCSNGVTLFSFYKQLS
jgi:hypothetical protein